MPNHTYAVLANARLTLTNRDPERAGFVDLSRGEKEARVILEPGESKTVELDGRPGDVTEIVAADCVSVRRDYP